MTLRKDLLKFLATNERTKCDERRVFLVKSKAALLKHQFPLGIKNESETRKDAKCLEQFRAAVVTLILWATRQGIGFTSVDELNEAAQLEFHKIKGDREYSAKEVPNRS